MSVVCATCGRSTYVALLCVRRLSNWFKIYFISLNYDLVVNICCTTLWTRRILRTTHSFAHVKARWDSNVQCIDIRIGRLNYDVWIFFKFYINIYLKDGPFNFQGWGLGRGRVLWFFSNKIF